MEKKEGAVHFAVVLGMLAMPRQEVVSEPGVIVIEDLPRASWACVVRARLRSPEDASVRNSNTSYTAFKCSPAKTSS